MSQLLLINPRRRRKHRVRARKRRGARRMTAKQLKYFGPRKRRVSRSRRRSAPAFLANPRKRKYRRRGRSVSRSARRIGGQIRASFGGITSSLKTGVTGGAGAVVVDMAMGQAAQYLPATLTSRYSADGTLNYSYYATKAALAIGLGIVGQRYLPGNMKRLAATGAEGALVVMSYEILRSVLPANLTMGYFNPAIVTQSGNVTSMGKYLSQRPCMGKYLQGSASGANGSAWSDGSVGNMNMRVGEGTIR